MTVTSHRGQWLTYLPLVPHRSKKTSKLCITGLCEGNSQVTGEFPTQRVSSTENVSIWCLTEILIKTQNFSFTKMHLNISSAKWQPLCPGGDEFSWLSYMESPPTYHGSHPCSVLCNQGWVHLSWSRSSPTPATLRWQSPRLLSDWLAYWR